ncbi:MAG: glycosyltransferase [Bacteroides sp.]|nr:glycosyltransferase [Bacteroides sp.]
MKNDCIVSVVIPVYNSERSLGACLERLLRQTLRETEIICVDDGSTDMSAEILKKYAAADPRVKFLSQENRGPGSARNHGLKEAVGEYVIFLDSDDLFEPSMLERMVREIRDANADMVVCRADSFDNITGETLFSEWKMPIGMLNEGLTFSPSDKSDVLFQLFQGWPWDKMFRTDFVRRHGLKYPDLPNSQDLVFVFEALVLAKKISVIDKVLVHRRMNRSSSVSNSRSSHIESPYNAVMIFSEMMKDNRLWELYQSSFYRWVLNFWLWHFTTLAGEPQKKCFSLMKKEWFPKFNFDALEKGNYDPRDYKLYKKIVGGTYRGYLMNQRLRAFLKRIVPPPVNIFNRELGDVKRSVSELEIKLDELSEANAQIIAMLQKYGQGAECNNNEKILSDKDKT